MKRTIALAITALTLALILASCPAAFDLSAKSLKGQTITYAINGSSHDKAVFAFDSAGTAGTVEVAQFSYDYPDAAAEASGDHTKKIWYQRSGSKGTFTYNPETYDFTFTVTEEYGRKAGATTDYAADYAYQSLVAVMSARDSKAYSSYSSSIASKVIFNQDNCSFFSSIMRKKSSASRAMGPETDDLGVFFASDSAWSFPMSMVEEYVLDGVSTKESRVSSDSIEISASAITRQSTRVETLTVGSAAPVVETYTTVSYYTVENVFLIGSTEDGQSFAEVWKDDNAVTFGVVQTRRDVISYAGAAAPAAPTTFNADGYGATVVGNDYYRIYNDQYASRMSLTKKEGYIASPAFFGSATRGE